MWGFACHCAHSPSSTRSGGIGRRTPAPMGGSLVNNKNTQRLWREEGLRVPIRRRRKRRGSSTGQAPVKAAYPHHVWAIDFQADHLDDGIGFTIARTIGEERIRRIVPLTPTRRVVEHHHVRHVASCTSRTHRLAPRIQPHPTALQPRLQDPHRIR